VNLWTLPDSYCGASWPDYYIFLGQNRDSSALQRSNFRVALERLGGETGEDDNGISLVTVVRESHWACGWIEWIAIHKTATEQIKLAEEMESKLEDYPVLCEDDWSNLEYEEAMSYWESLSLENRIEMCAEKGVSIFVARRTYDLPDAIYNSLIA